MQFGDFRDLVTAYSKQHGQPYIPFTAGGDYNALINRELQNFTAATLCLYKDNVVFTIPITGVYATTSTAVYSLRDLTVFSSLLYLPKTVIVNNNELIATGQSDARRDLRGFLTESLGQPSYWSLNQPHHMRLYPSPVSVYSNNYVMGYCLHPELSADNTELSIPHEYSRCAAAWCSLALLEPDSDMDVYQRMDKISMGAGRQMLELESYAKSLSGGRVRKTRTMFSVR